MKGEKREGEKRRGKEEKGRRERKGRGECKSACVGAAGPALHMVFCLDPVLLLLLLGLRNWPRLWSGRAVLKRSKCCCGLAALSAQHIRKDVCRRSHQSSLAQLFWAAICQRLGHCSAQQADALGESHGLESHSMGGGRRLDQEASTADVFAV